MVSNLGTRQDHTGLRRMCQASLGFTALRPQPELPPARQDKDPLAEELGQGWVSGPPALSPHFYKSSVTLDTLLFLVCKMNLDSGIFEL